MKIKELASLLRQLAPHLPGTVVRGPMLLASPAKQTVRGVYLEGSSYDANRFYVWAFWMPLFVPTERITLSLGKRVRGAFGERWDAETPHLLEHLVKAIRAEALPLLRLVEAPRGLVEAARAAAAGNRDPHAHQALAYALAHAGETQAAVDAIGVLLGLLDPAIPWQAEMRSRAALLKTRLLEDPKEVFKILEGWRMETIRKLRLEDIA